MKNGLKDIIGKQIAHDDTPHPATLEELLQRDLDAWREAKAAIAKAKG
jgi:hypothetical protein